MDALSHLEEIAQEFALTGLEAILVGNAATAPQGAPVTTLDFDFLVPASQATFTKLKQFAKVKALAIYRPVAPASQLFRLMRDPDQFQLDFHARIDGISSYQALRTDARSISFGGQTLLIASLADVIRSKRAAGRSQDLAILPTLEDTLMPKAKPAGRRPNLKAQFEIMRLALIDLTLALPPERRTNFLRKRIGICSSAL